MSASVAVATHPAAGSEPAVPPPWSRGEWQTLPPIQRVLPDHPLINPVQRFTATLTSWNAPSYLAPLGHRIGPAEPSGVVTGLAVPVQPVQRSAPSPHLPVAQPLERRAGGFWSRLFAGAAEPSGAPVQRDAGAIADPLPPGGDPSHRETGSAPPPDAASQPATPQPDTAGRPATPQPDTANPPATPLLGAPVVLRAGSPPPATPRRLGLGAPFVPAEARSGSSALNTGSEAPFVQRSPALGGPHGDNGPLSDGRSLSTLGGMEQTASDLDAVGGGSVGPGPDPASAFGGTIPTLQTSTGETAGLGGTAVTWPGPDLAGGGEDIVSGGVAGGGGTVAPLLPGSASTGTFSGSTPGGHLEGRLDRYCRPTRRWPGHHPWQHYHRAIRPRTCLAFRHHPWANRLPAHLAAQRPGPATTP